MAKDPYLNYRFKIEMKGITVGGFQEITIGGSNVEVVEYREGGDNTSSRKLPGAPKYEDIVLKRGVTDDLILYSWHKDVLNGDLKKYNGFIVLYDSQGNPGPRWEFKKAWPSKWDAPSLNASGKGEIAISSITLVHEGITRASD